MLKTPESKILSIDHGNDLKSQPESIIEALSKIPKTDKSYAEANLVIGQIYKKYADEKSNPSGFTDASKIDAQKAISYLTLAVENSTTLSVTDTTRLLLGKIHNSLGEHEQAISHLSKIEEPSPNYLEALSALAYSHIKLKKWHEKLEKEGWENYSANYSSKQPSRSYLDALSIDAVSHLKLKKLHENQEEKAWEKYTAIYSRAIRTPHLRIIIEHADGSSRTEFEGRTPHVKPLEKGERLR